MRSPLLLPWECLAQVLDPKPNQPISMSQGDDWLQEHALKENIDSYIRIPS